MDTITVTDVGPVKSLSIPIQPGVTVILGPNDSGKSETQKAVSRLTGGDDAVTCRKTAASGCVEGLGAKLSVRQSARRSGELEAVSLSGDLDISDLADPPIKDPSAADKHRIKELLRLTGVKADFALFSYLGDLSGHVSFEATKTDDLVEMAAKVKKDLEAASRKEGDLADKADAKAFACKQQAEGIDTNIETDAGLLQAKLEDALYAQGEISANATAAREAADRAALAKDRLAKEASPPDVEGAKAEVERQETFTDRLIQLEKDLASKLAVAKQEREKAEQAASEARQRLKLEEAHAETVLGWKETIAAGESIARPTPEQIEAATASVTKAREAIEKAAVARNAKEKAEEAKSLYSDVKLHRKEADRLRDAARATDDVLSAAVASDSIAVKAGRLVTQHPEYGEVFYGERSIGTRYRLAIREAVKRIHKIKAEKTAVIVIPQEAWEGLQPKVQREIDGYAKEMEVCVLAAKADDGELRAEAFGGVA